jgi:hypothetical protein
MLFLNKNMTVDNVQKHSSCNDVPLAQTFRCYFSKGLLLLLSVFMSDLKLSLLVNAVEFSWAPSFIRLELISGIAETLATPSSVS